MAEGGFTPPGPSRRTPTPSPPRTPPRFRTPPPRTISIDPFHYFPKRRRTGRTPPPPISPLGSPPEKTPARKQTPTREERMWSPQKHPWLMPVFNVRDVWTPPNVLLSPFYGHSTPKSTRPDKQPPGGWTPGSMARWINWSERQREFKKMPIDLRELYSPVRYRQDADSLFESPLIPFGPRKRDIFSPPSPPPRSPHYSRAETPPRSPAVQLMREEIKKDTERRKYAMWYFEHFQEAAMRDVVVKAIHAALEDRLLGIDYEKMDVYQTIAVLSEYLKGVTDKLLTQNLELPPLATNNPALDIVEQKKISIQRIIREYKKQYEDVARKLKWTKDKIQAKNDPERWDLLNYRRKKMREDIEGLNVETRMERIVAKKGLCFDWCPKQKDMNHYNLLNRPMEEQVDELRRKAVELDAECMEACSDMIQFVNFVTPNLLKNLAAFIRGMFPGSKFHKIAPETYEDAAKDVSKHLRRIFREKRHGWVDINREVNYLYPMIKEQTEEVERIRDNLEYVKKDYLRRIAEFKKHRSHFQNMGWMIRKARNTLEYYEQGYASTYQALNRQKKNTDELETELGMSPTGPPEMSSPKEPHQTASPIITLPTSPNSFPSPHGETLGSPVHASSPAFRSSPSRLEAEDSLHRERPPPEMMNMSDLSQSGGAVASERTLQSPAGPFLISPFQDGGGSDALQAPVGSAHLSPFQDGGGSDASERTFQAPGGSGNLMESSPIQFTPVGRRSTIKKTVTIPSPGKREQLQIDIEIIPQDIRRSRSGQRVVCDLAVELQEAAVKPPRRIERKYRVVRGSPPISQTVGRRVDRREKMFTPRTVIRRGYMGIRRPLFADDFESPESPFGTGRRTHPELMSLPERSPSPRSPRLDTTIEWENPEMNTAFMEGFRGR